MCSLPWEQKNILQSLKPVVVNAFEIWRFAYHNDLLNRTNAFEGLDKFRSKINSIWYIGSFIVDLCPALIRNAEQLASRFSSREGDGRFANSDEALVQVESAKEGHLGGL